MDCWVLPVLFPASLCFLNGQAQNGRSKPRLFVSDFCTAAMHLVVLLWIAGGCYATMLVGHSSCQQSQDFTDKNQGFFFHHIP